MTGDNIASFIYLALLGSAIAGYFLVANRHQLGRVGQQAAIWALIFVGIAAAAALFDDIRRDAPGQQSVQAADGRIEVTRASDGHYHLTLEVNGTPIEFLVDTGATDLVLSVQDAERVGIDHASLDFSQRAMTANGTVQTAPVWLETVALGTQVDEGVPAQVSGGAMPGSLLGMSYLSQFREISISDGRMVLTP